MQEHFSHQPGKPFSYPGPGAFAADSADRKHFRSAYDAEASLREERERRRHQQRLLEMEQRTVQRARDSAPDAKNVYHADDLDEYMRGLEEQLDGMTLAPDSYEDAPQKESMRRPHRFSAPKPKAETVPAETLEERRLRFKREMRLLAQNYAHTLPESRDFRHEVEADLRAQRDREWMKHERGMVLPSRDQIAGRYPEQKPRREELEDRERLARWNRHLVENTPDTVEYDADRELEEFLMERARERRRT